jgi:hypothetical protein
MQEGILGCSVALRRCQSPKMAGVLNTSMSYEQRSVIRFPWSKGRTPIEIHREMQLTYGDKCGGGGGGGVVISLMAGKTLMTMSGRCGLAPRSHRMTLPAWMQW